MPLRYDAVLKDIVASHPGDFAAVFGLPVGEPVTPMNVDLSTISAATDVALGFGEPLQEIVDLNFQSGPDTRLAERLHMYNAALNVRHGVPALSVVVLLRKKADATNLSGKLTYGRDECRVEFGYRVIRLWQEPVESYLRSGLAALPLATLCELPAGTPIPAALREVVREIERRLHHEADEAQAARLRTATIILTQLRVRKSDLKAIYEGVERMQEELTAYDEDLELERQAELRRSHRLLLRLAKEQFGEADAAIEAELEAITDLDHLERLAVAVLKCNSWKEMLATP